MLSGRIVAGPKASGEALVGGDVAQWVLANDGTVSWPEGTTLRLVGGPVLLCPLVEVPAVAPGQTVDIELEVQPTEQPAEVFYSLVTPSCEAFGEIAHARVSPLKQTSPPAQPAVVLISSTLDSAGGALEAMQGELKTVEWTLANVGHAKWPEDVRASLVFNTPGFEHLPGHIDVPALEPGMTVEAGITALMPERAGQWKAIWAVNSPTHPEFGELLVAEFIVDDFPFMDWMLEDEAKADSISDVQSEADGGSPPPKSHLSMAIAMQQHIFVGGTGDVEYPEVVSDLGIESIGQVSGLPAGTPWVLELAITNDAMKAWPDDTALMCCFGSGFGCVGTPVGGLESGQTLLLQVELVGPESPGRSAWVLTCGQGCFGPVMMLDVV
eukprot:TRINITY_DN9858_c0_g1_i1.p1 TRINITY_DN9858_c0_g1~~TRINITY_DN9858_c0_g1_i1.p1  ORF type:complete len:383 (+),score=72.65 TRINITY_DN9858_c0_g1_i1:132-1280(+)